MQKYVKLLLVPLLHAITNGLIKTTVLFYEAQIKFKGFIMLQRIDLCRFQAKQTFILATEASSK